MSRMVVDHGLRLESSDEAAEVAGWLQDRGIETRILPWTGRKPDRGVQAAARDARYDLLLAWCRDQGVKDLLLAHHRDDQAETFLLRLGRGSGVDGLAAMSAVSHRGDVRLVRPLLDVPKARLTATLKDLQQSWIEDPSNNDPAYARSRIRGLGPALAGIGVTPEGIAVTARRMGRARAALEQYASELIRASVEMHPAGFCWLDHKILRGAPEEVGLRVLSRVVSTVGSRQYPPRHDRLERLYAHIAGSACGSGRTLAGCRVIGLGQRILVCREGRGAGERMPIAPGQNRRWDGRFDVRLWGGSPTKLDQSCEVRRLGSEGWRFVIADHEMRQRARDLGLPAAVRMTLPALWDQDGVLDVPHLKYRRESDSVGLEAKFAPARPLDFPPFSVVSTDTPPI